MKVDKVIRGRWKYESKPKIFCAFEIELGRIATRRALKGRLFVHTLVRVWEVLSTISHLGI